MPDAGISATIVFPLFNFALRAIQTSYEIAAVPAETSDHLKTISQVLLDLQTARALRRDKVAYLSDDDLVRIDTVVRNTEEALTGLERLVERARVDMSLYQNNVRAQSRLMWVIRDSNKVTAALSRLTVVSQSLHAEIISMRLAGTTSYQDGFSQYPPPKYSYSSPASVSNYSLPNPDLRATIEACAERREWIKRRHSVNRTDAVQCMPTLPAVASERTRSNSFDDDIALSPSINNVAEYIRENEAILSTIAPMSSVGRWSDPTPARVVESNLGNEMTVPAPSGVSEIDSGVPVHVVPSVRPYAFSTPNLRYESSEIPYTSDNAGTRQRRQSLSPTIRERPTLQYRLSSNAPGNNQTPRVRTPRSNSNTMQSTALVIGSRVPREIVWNEPIAEEPRERNLQQNADTNTLNTDHDPPPAYHAPTDVPPSLGSNRQPLNSTRRSTRRPPRVYSAPEPEPEPEPPIVPATGTPIVASGSLVGRNVRVRHARTGWALDEHNREAIHATARNNT